MATRLENKFAELKEAGRKALIIYITAGMPDAAGTIEAIESVVTDGNTRYYFKLAGDDTIYIAGISANQGLPFIAPGAQVTVTYTEKEGVREVTSLVL